MRKIEKYRLAACVAMAIVTLLDPATARSAETAPPVGGRELAVELGAPFHDHAILQRGMKVPVWGWSKPGTKVTVTFADQNKTATAGKDGKWLLHLDPLKANSEPAEMVITEAGGKTETLTDILVGEVWLASGQSNMQYPVCKQDTMGMPKEILARVKEGKEKMPMIREVQVPGWGATLRPVERAKAQWSDDWNNMSAIAFAFAYEIEKELKIPVGIVNCSFSQTPIEGWAHSDGFKGGEDQFTKDIYQSILDKDPAKPGFKAAWDAYGTKVREWAKKADELAGRGFRPNPIPEVPGPNPMPELPVDFRFGNRGATWLYNAKTHPMAPYAIRGVIWNQGYHNSNDGFVYRNNLHSLVRSFRSVWSNPELPVYFHQFYSTGYDDGIALNPMAEMRLGTWVASKEIPNVAMASQIDIYGGVHYFYKRLPGQRLAWHALKNQYGKNIVANGPMYKGYKVEAAKLVLELDHAEGLCAGKCFPHTPTEPATAKTDGVSVDDVKLFYLADGDLKWHPAKAVIKGSTIELTSATVKEPRGVAYGCNGVGDLPGIYNKAMLPLTPFIYYDHKLVVSPQWKWDTIKIPSAPLDVMVWPMEYFARGDREVDMTTYGIGLTYCKLPVLASQFRDGAVLQAGVPVRIYGGAIPGSVVKVTFAGQEQTITIGPDTMEYEATFPAMKASAKPVTIHAACYLEGTLAHERRASNVLIGEVWYVAVNNARMPNVPVNPKYDPPTGPIRMLQSASAKSADAMPNRFDLGPRSLVGRYYARWQPPAGLAKELGERIHAKTGTPVGVIVINTTEKTAIKDYVSYESLDKIPAWQADKESLHRSYNPDTTFYQANVDAYLKGWQEYWKRVSDEPGFAQSDASGGMPGYPRPPSGANTTATTRYNWAICNFSPAAFKGVICFTPATFVGEDEGAGFGEQFSVMANCWKEAFSYGKQGLDPQFVYTLPAKTLAPQITPPTGIKGASTAVEVTAWPDLTAYDAEARAPAIGDDVKAVLDAAVKAVY